MNSGVVGHVMHSGKAKTSLHRHIVSLNHQNKSSYNSLVSMKEYADENQLKQPKGITKIG